MRRGNLAWLAPVSGPATLDAVRKGGVRSRLGGVPVFVTRGATPGHPTVVPA